jgi:cell wall-associated NlpC family hydrolase
MIFAHGRHAKPSTFVKTCKVAAPVITGTTLLTAMLTVGTDTSAQAAEVSWGAVNSYGNVALNWAETQQGKPYEWGGTGPSAYDCSGLVQAAYEHAGINLPRTTYDMLDSSHLVRTYHPERGDLAFYGSGHVELVTVWHDQTFGAHDTGSTIGWITYGGYWVPTAYYRVVK